MTKKIAPSLLSADFSTLKTENETVENAGADLLHIDVMDGHFVPNITLGPFIVSAVRKCTKLPLDCHLMIENPEKYVDAFIKAGANMISVHAEVIQDEKIFKTLRNQNIKVGLALNPDKPLNQIEHFLPHVDYVLIMSVFAGFGGQVYLSKSTQKIKDLVRLRRKQKLSFEIEVDGGIKLDNVSEIAHAGADILVSGSGIFKSKDVKATIQSMKEKANE